MAARTASPAKIGTHSSTSKSSAKLRPSMIEQPRCSSAYGVSRASLWRTTLPPQQKRFLAFSGGARRAPPQSCCHPSLTLLRLETSTNKPHSNESLNQIKVDQESSEARESQESLTGPRPGARLSTGVAVHTIIVARTWAYKEHTWTSIHGGTIESIQGVVLWERQQSQVRVQVAIYASRMPGYQRDIT